MRIWSEKTITDALALFALNGEATVICDSPAHANRFRLSVYNYIRRKKLDIQIQLSTSGTDVIFRVPQTESAELRISD